MRWDVGYYLGKCLNNKERTVSKVYLCHYSVINNKGNVLKWTNGTSGSFVSKCNTSNHLSCIMITTSHRLDASINLSICVMCINQLQSYNAQVC